MREIRFRGKVSRGDNLGKWVVGDLAHSIYPNLSKYVIFDDTATYSIGEYVDERTIGQSTGMRDANGKEVYEGDILSTNLCVQFTFAVMWSEKRHALELHREEDGEFRFYDFLRQPLLSLFEVIGNIYDNQNIQK